MGAPPPPVLPKPTRDEMTRTAAPHGFVTKTLHWVSATLLAFGYV